MNSTLIIKCYHVMLAMFSSISLRRAIPYKGCCMLVMTLWLLTWNMVTIVSIGLSSTSTHLLLPTFSLSFVYQRSHLPRKRKLLINAPMVSCSLWLMILILPKMLHCIASTLLLMYMELFTSLWELPNMQLMNSVKYEKEFVIICHVELKESVKRTDKFLVLIRVDYVIIVSLDLSVTIRFLQELGNKRVKQIIRLVDHDTWFPWRSLKDNDILWCKA